FINDRAALFRPAVAIQQMFSLLQQSPSGAIRLADMTILLNGLLSSEDIQGIVGQLEALNYLKPARAGEWRAGERLNTLADQQANPYQSLSLYSNIKGSDGRKIEIRNHITQEVLAHVDAQWLDQPALTLEGRTLTVEWFDGEAMWISTSKDQQFTNNL